jgi:CheY-like chemotaxis protein
MQNVPDRLIESCLPSLSDPLPALNEPFLRPLKERRAQPRSAKNDGSNARRAPQDRTILVVDDSPFERTVIRSAVEGLTQFRVCGEASDGVEGIKKALELKPDLVIMDLAMPQMNGAEAAMVLRNAMPKVPVVLFTLYAEQLRRAISPGFGVTLILSKADGLAPLLECLETLLDK